MPLPKWFRSIVGSSIFQYIYKASGAPCRVDFPWCLNVTLRIAADVGEWCIMGNVAIFISTKSIFEEYHHFVCACSTRVYGGNVSIEIGGNTRDTKNADAVCTVQK
jgi:hypothetical protein